MEADNAKNVDRWHSLYTNNILDVEKLKKKLKVHISWEEFLNTNYEALQKVIEKIKEEDCAPNDPEKIFRFLEKDLDKVKVIILGQDPYPYPNFATGRAFEVGTISTWKDLTLPFLKSKGQSLKKIIICVYRNNAGDNQINKYDEVLKKIEDGIFKIAPPKQWFDSMEEQGVLFLNTSLTCKLNGKPGSHTKVWNSKNDGFTTNLLKYINRKNTNIHWFIWGKAAEGCINRAKLNIRYELRCSSFHPVASKPITDERSFLNFKGFSSVSKIDWLGLETLEQS